MPENKEYDTNKEPEQVMDVDDELRVILEELKKVFDNARNA